LYGSNTVPQAGRRPILGLQAASFRFNGFSPIAARCAAGSTIPEEGAVKALVLYVLFVVIGGLISVGIGYYVEVTVSNTASLIVFLVLFFANFAISWIGVILVMDGTLRNAQGRQDQLDTERAGQAMVTARKAARTAE
jgi:hypothetical protein